MRALIAVIVNGERIDTYLDPLNSSSSDIDMEEWIRYYGGKNGVDVNRGRSMEQMSLFGSSSIPSAGDHRLLVVDTETSGLDPAWHSILSVAAVIVEQDGREVDSFEVRVAERFPVVTSEAAKVHGLDVREGVSPDIATIRMLNFLDRNQMIGEIGRGLRRRVELVGHNVQFDAGFLRRMFKLSNVSFEAHFSHRMLCTQSLAFGLMLAGKLPAQSAGLEDVARALSVPLRREPYHDALEDCRATVAVYAKLMDMLRRIP